MDRLLLGVRALIGRHSTAWRDVVCQFPTSLTCRLSWARLNPDDGFVSPQRGEGFSCYRKILCHLEAARIRTIPCKSQLFVEPQPSDIANRRAAQVGLSGPKSTLRLWPW